MGQSNETVRGLDEGNEPDDASPVSARSAVYECVICLKDIIVRPGGKVRIEGVLRGEDWVWGPYPAHERCRLDLRTPFDRQIGDGLHVAHSVRLSVDDPETAALLGSWAKMPRDSLGKRSPGELSRYTAPLETPWPEFTELLDLGERALAGLVAARGSKEATSGTWIAVHAAVSGKKALLFTGYPPPLTRPLLITNDASNPTPEDVGSAIDTAQPDVVVIERWERMSTDTPVEGGRADELDSIGQDLKRVVAQWGIPTLVTTSVPGDINLNQRLPQWLDYNAPASIMLDFCKPLLVVKRTSPAEVHVRLERHGSRPDHTQQAVAWKA